MMTVAARATQAWSTGTTGIYSVAQSSCVLQPQSKLNEAVTDHSPVNRMRHHSVWADQLKNTS